MKHFLGWGLIIFLLASCRSKDDINVDQVQHELKVVHFEKDFFELDTFRVADELVRLKLKYPYFFSDFLYQILGLPAQVDSLSVVEKNVKRFIRTYHQVYQQASKIQYEQVETDLLLGIKRLKYYFPQYPFPTQLVYFVGPINSYANVLIQQGIAVGLQMHLGKDHPLYQSAESQILYPSYLSKNFSPEYIAIQSIKNIITDLMPASPKGRPLIEQMIELGKQQYLLHVALPNVADTLKFGYTQQQLEGCKANEAGIWSFFLQNELLFATEPALIAEYVNEGPKTTALGEGSPGNIGLFVGYQIVSKWMKDQNKSVQELIQTKAIDIFNQAKYKPN